MSFDLTGFSGFFIKTTSTPLPIELLSFRVTKKEKTDLLEWTTASEVNNSHFNVQRSANAVDFETLGKVNSKAANGLSGTEIDYSFVDENPIVGNNFYRLQQVDIDGNKTFSKVINIVWTDQNNAVRIYPNPTKGDLNIEFTTQESGNVELKIIDMSGRVVKSILSKSQEGENQFQISMSELANGIYHIQLLENGQTIYNGKVRKE